MHHNNRFFHPCVAGNTIKIAPAANNITFHPRDADNANSLSSKNRQLIFLSPLRGTRSDSSLLAYDTFFTPAPCGEHSATYKIYSISLFYIPAQHRENILVLSDFDPDGFLSPRAGNTARKLTPKRLAHFSSLQRRGKRNHF